VLFLPARVWLQIPLNRRLPRTTQRVACLFLREIDDSKATLGETSLWAIPGSRLFNRSFGLARTGKNMRGRWARTKAAPLQGSQNQRTSGSSSLPLLHQAGLQDFLPSLHYTLRGHYPAEQFGFDSAIRGLIY
jgi:hypothetical protein